MTGYIYRMLDEEQDFPTFVLHCARGIDVLHEWCEEAASSDPAEAPCYAQAVEDAQAKLDAIRERVDAVGVEAYGRMLQQAAITLHSKLEAEETAKAERCEAMRRAVDAWTPPTPLHRGLKKFMQGQLRDQWDGAAFHRSRREECERMVPREFVEEAGKDAAHLLEYHETCLKKHRERLELARAWLAELRASLGRS